MFKKGQKISDWFDDKLGYSKELMAKLRSEPYVGFHAEKACLIYTFITKRISDFVVRYHARSLHKWLHDS